jgi:hypothetical protein
MIKMIEVTPDHKKKFSEKFCYGDFVECFYWCGGNVCCDTVGVFNHALKPKELKWLIKKGYIKED